MLIVQRQQQLLDILRERHSVELDDLAEALDVSTSTVRRDLETLERRGLVQRTHGGAVYLGEQRPPTDKPTYALATRMTERVESKRAIARVAAGLIEPHMTVLLDGGSTVVFAAEAIEARPLQVLTNSISIANLFKDDERIELTLLGGTLYPRTEVTLGPLTTGTLADLHADLLLFSTVGIYGEDCFNLNLEMARTEQVMMLQATRSVMLMDSSKFGRKSMARVCSLAEVDHVITDDGVDAVWRETLADRLTVAPGGA
jgi:DeoR family transcriptional regulator, fructose operon transcriptional repressor